MSPTYLYGTGPVPDSALCLGCHDDVLTAGVHEAPLGPFSDGPINLHRTHGAALGAADGAWCLACHAPHASNAARAQLRLQPIASKAPPSAALRPVGGSCSGGCHADAPAAYAGRPFERRSVWP
jgi:hypothetical protein